MLRELARSYLTLMREQIRVMNRLKALYSHFGDSLCWDVTSTTGPSSRVVRRSCANRESPTSAPSNLCRQLDAMQRLRPAAPSTICWWKVASSASAASCDRLPYVGPIRAALLIALLQNTHTRFRTSGDCKVYSQLVLEIHWVFR